MLLSYVRLLSRNAAEIALAGLWLCMERNAWTAPSVRVEARSGDRVWLRFQTEARRAECGCMAADCPFSRPGAGQTAPQWCKRWPTHRRPQPHTVAFHTRGLRWSRPTTGSLPSPWRRGLVGVALGLTKRRRTPVRS